MTTNWENIFKESSALLFKGLNSDETLNINFSAEETTFIRFNGGKVRQGTEVEQGEVSLELIKGSKKTNLSVPVSLDLRQNDTLLTNALEYLQKEIITLADDPYVVQPQNGGESRTVLNGELPEATSFVELIKESTQGIDLAGYLSSGKNMRGNANSLGQNHWFESESFNFDYSLYTAKEKAVKGEYAGSNFTKDGLLASLEVSKTALSVMDREQVELKPGKYRVYLAPSAVNEIAGLLGWHAMSGGAYKRGESPLADLYDGKKSFSDKVSMKENFKLGLSPRFNEWGEVAKEEISLITKGKMDTLLVSKETEKEYGLTSNQASGFEGPRALEINTGDLKRDDVYSTLKDGLYISNLHYLNWSDKNKGRITGMTRFGCLKVENGEVVGPIKDLRFDETLYQIFGEAVESVTDFSDVMMEAGTYGSRSLGGSKLPGLLLKEFTFTL
jgi:predicted Zn-dependent protease